jgi:cation:H+ antiporter
LLSCIGLVLLVISGKLIVKGSVSIAELYEIDPFLVGATIVCIGTSIPELATTLISSWKGRVEIGLGTVLGSNLFNGLFIVPIAAIINPIPIQIQEVAVSLLFGFMTVAFTYPSSNGTIGRSRGILLLVVYLIYMATVIQSS